MWTVQDNYETCVCSERHQCLWCLERTAAHTLLSFSNSNNIHQASFAVSSRTRAELNSRDVKNGCAKPPAVLSDTEVNIDCQSSFDGTTPADIHGMTAQMKRSRLAQVGKFNLKTCLLTCFLILLHGFLQFMLSCHS